jgi:aminopeptidase
MKNIKKQAIINFLSYLKNHQSQSVFCYYEPSYKDLSKEIQATALENKIDFSCFEISDLSVTDFTNNFSDNRLYIFVYDASSRSHPAPDCLNILRQEFRKLKQCTNIIRLVNINDYFNEIFVSPSEYIYILNKSLIDLGKKSKIMHITDNNGSSLEIELDPNKWDNVDGSLEIADFIPSEIANGPSNVNGVIYFTGGFLSQIPLAKKYGLITEPLKLTVKDRKIIDIDTKNSELKKDILEILQDNPGNAILEEAGIGTNPGVKLRGLGLPFEERHCGFHAGFGGLMENSLHWDIIFGQSKISFDNKLIFDSSKGFLI